MSRIDVSDIQGFALKGYNFPRARYLLLELLAPEAARTFVLRLLPIITTGERWDINSKPTSTVNLAFTHKGNACSFELPPTSLLSFPLEFQQGMKARGDILYDTGKNGSENWEPVWKTDSVHAWLAVNAQTPERIEACRGSAAVNDGNGWRESAGGSGCLRNLFERQTIDPGTLWIYRRVWKSGFQRR